MRLLSATILILGFAGSLAAQEKKYESKEGKFAVGFTGVPKSDSKKVGELTMHTTSIEGKGVGFMVIYADLPADTVKDMKADEILTNGEKGLVNGFKAKVTKSASSTFGKNKLPSREVTAEVDVDGATLHLRLLLVLADGRLYQVLAIGSKENVFGVGSNVFFDSFEIRP